MSYTRKQQYRRLYMEVLQQLKQTHTDQKEVSSLQLIEYEEPMVTTPSYEDDLL